MLMLLLTICQVEAMINCTIETEVMLIATGGLKRIVKTEAGGQLIIGLMSKMKIQVLFLVVNSPLLPLTLWTFTVKEF